MGCIYYHKNKINGYMYIGQSKCNSDYIKYGRWGANGQGYKANKYFWHAIKKYGWENFEHGFFEDNVNNELLNEKEKYYIALYHTYRQDPDYKSGYNLTPGGEGSMNTWWPEEDAWLVDNYSLDKTREQLINEYYQAFPESYHSKAAIKARLKTLRLSNVENINFWNEDENKKLIELWSDATKEEILRAFPKRNYETIRRHASYLKLKRKLNYNIYSLQEENILKTCYEKYGPEYCRAIIKEKLAIDRSLNSIRDHSTKVLKLHCHEKFTAKVGFDLQSFANYYKAHSVKETAVQFNMTATQVNTIAGKNNFKRDKSTIKTGITPAKVCCVELHKIFNSAKEATDFLKIKQNNKNSILRCCQGKRKTVCGYHWRYLKEGEN